VPTTDETKEKRKKRAQREGSIDLSGSEVLQESRLLRVACVMTVRPPRASNGKRFRVKSAVGPGGAARRAAAAAASTSTMSSSARAAVRTSNSIAWSHCAGAVMIRPTPLSQPAGSSSVRLETAGSRAAAFSVKLYAAQRSIQETETNHKTQKQIATHAAAIGQRSYKAAPDHEEASTLRHRYIAARTLRRTSAEV